MYMRDFYDGLNQSDSMFSSKDIILTKMVQLSAIQEHLICGCQQYGYQPFTLFVYNESFPK